MKILHVFRTPVGGLFRHVRDLVRGQSELGHEVGILCDSSTGGAVADNFLAAIAPLCSLGIQRIQISRLPGLGDISATLSTKAHARKIAADIIHCHGAKGGLYGRLAARSLGLPSVYTPHGGSLHYMWLALPGALYLASEWLLAKIGSGMIFVCNYERQVFISKIGLAGKPGVVVYNGLWPTEFTKVEPAQGAADVFFMGDMRFLKGVDVLVNALARVNSKRRTTANLVGDGPDLAHFQKQVQSLGLTEMVKFQGRMATAEALKSGHVLVMPSRAESFPYVILEAAAGQVPMIASDVGGISEILPPQHLCPPDNAEALARHIEMALSIPDAIREDARALSDKIRSAFSAADMARKITEFYQQLS